jgi:hypothetical protein
MLSVVSCGFGSSGLQSLKIGEGGSSSDGQVDDSNVGGDDAPNVSALDGEEPGSDAARDANDGKDATKTPGDASPSDGAPNDGGPNPGSVACAGSDCPLSSGICCPCPNCFPPYPTSCYPTFPGCVSGAPLYCDDRSDCSANQVCCATFTGNLFVGSSCKAMCGTNDVQMCRVNAECVKGSCQTSTKFPDYTTCM